MACRIFKDKTTGEEFLVPDCYPVVNRWNDKDLSDREIIKQWCSCSRPSVDKYEEHTRDEVISMIEKMEAKILKHKEQLEKMEQELDCIKSEVFMLNTIEVF